MSIVREIIEIKSVSLVEVIEEEIGYISMRQTRFSERTSEEVEQAVRNLIIKNVKGIILDLRGNPGGLLTQATQVADLFLPKGAPIVSIRERDGRREQAKLHSESLLGVISRLSCSLMIAVRALLRLLLGLFKIMIVVY